MKLNKTEVKLTLSLHIKHRHSSFKFFKSNDKNIAVTHTQIFPVIYIQDLPQKPIRMSNLCKQSFNDKRILDSLDALVALLKLPTGTSSKNELSLCIMR